MKTLKISLAIIVVAAIAFFVIRSKINTTSLPPPPSGENPFVERIKHEIDSLSKLPDSRFSGEFYMEVVYHINNYYSLSKISDKWKEILMKNLYSAYADKFIIQAFYVFDGSAWEIEDLNFIRNEYQTLKKSDLLEKDSPVDKKFNEIQTVLSKYDETVNFISTCNRFSYSSLGLSDRFPVSEVQNKISRASTYLTNGNPYIKNCTRMHNELKKVAQVLFIAHVKYLDNKIIKWSNLYSQYRTLNDYKNNLYTPLKNEIDAFNNIYKAANFNKEYVRLSNRWSDDYTRAYKSYISN